MISESESEITFSYTKGTFCPTIKEYRSTNVTYVCDNSDEP